jgi:hypothetical protein
MQYKISFNILRDLDFNLKIHIVIECYVGCFLFLGKKLSPIILGCFVRIFKYFHILPSMTAIFIIHKCNLSLAARNDTF